MGTFPTNDEISMLRASDTSIPAPKTIQANLGGRSERVDAVKAYLSDKAEFADVLAMLPSVTFVRPVPMAGAKTVDGHVYLIKSGDFYKIGRSDELERRVREIRIALPDAATLVHSIATDDPPGIEAYWHRRFADQRANGEWFKLTPDDVKAFCAANSNNPTIGKGTALAAAMLRPGGMAMATEIPCDFLLSR